MHTIDVRPWRIVLLFGSVLLLAAYLPHPLLEDSLPQSIHSIVKTLVSDNASES